MQATLCFRNALVALLSCGLLASCQTVKTTQAGVVGIDRQQRMAVSAQSMDQSANKQ